MKIRLIVCMLATLNSGLAYGASFDCAKAKTKVEKLICTNPALNKADTQMGESYKIAIKKFPISGFVQTTQKIFLTELRNCAVDKNTKDSIVSCGEVLNARIKVLNDYASTTQIYARTKDHYEPESVVITISGTGNNIVLRYFGSWMPDAYNPKPFPDGAICNDEVKLTSKNGQLTAENTETSTIKITNEKVTMDVMCNPRTSINGEFSRIKQ